MPARGRPKSPEGSRLAFCAARWCLPAPAANASVLSSASGPEHLSAVTHSLVPRHPTNEDNEVRVSSWKAKTVPDLVRALRSNSNQENQLNHCIPIILPGSTIYKQPAAAPPMEDTCLTLGVFIFHFNLVSNTDVPIFWSTKRQSLSHPSPQAPNTSLQRLLLRSFTLKTWNIRE